MSTNILKTNRGDSFKYNFFVPSDEDISIPYMLTGTDVLYFALLYPNQKFEDALILKAYTVGDQNSDGYIQIEMSPKETQSLVSGIYYYTIKLQQGCIIDDVIDFTRDNISVSTLVERTKFLLNE